MNSFPCFQKENKSHLCQENGRNLAGNNKVLWIISPASRTKTKVIYVKNIGETWIEIAIVMNNLNWIQNGNKTYLFKENGENMDWIRKVLWIASPASGTKKKSHFCQENGTNMAWNNQVFWIISPASSTKTKVIYVQNIGETWIEIAKCYE